MRRLWLVCPAVHAGGESRAPACRSTVRWVAVRGGPDEGGKGLPGRRGRCVSRGDGCHWHCGLAGKTEMERRGTRGQACTVQGRRGREAQADMGTGAGRPASCCCRAASTAERVGPVAVVDLDSRSVRYLLVLVLVLVLVLFLLSPRLASPKLIAAIRACGDGEL